MYFLMFILICLYLFKLGFMEFHVIPCNSVEFDGIPWNSTELHGIPCNYVELHEIPRGGGATTVTTTIIITTRSWGHGGVGELKLQLSAKGSQGRVTQQTPPGVPRNFYVPRSP